MTVFAHSQTTNKLVNEAANDSARVSGQDRKIPPALGTNQIAGFGGFRPLASLEKNKTHLLHISLHIDEPCWLYATLYLTKKQWNKSLSNNKKSLLTRVYHFVEALEKSQIVRFYPICAQSDDGLIGQFYIRFYKHRRFELKITNNSSTPYHLNEWPEPIKPCQVKLRHTCNTFLRFLPEQLHWLALNWLVSLRQSQATRMIPFISFTRSLGPSPPATVSTDGRQNQNFVHW